MIPAEKQTYYSVVIDNDVHNVTGRKRTRFGYVTLLIKTHPNAAKDGYIFEHRVVKEMCLGRYLKENEVVHHKNGIKHDNRIDNLEVMDHAEHTIMHHTGLRRSEDTRRRLSDKARERWGTPDIKKDEFMSMIESEKPIREILQHYGIHQSTFYKLISEFGIENWYKSKRGRKKKR